MVETSDLIEAALTGIKEDGVDLLPNNYGQLVQAAKCYLDHYKVMIRRDTNYLGHYLHPNWPRTWHRTYWRPEEDPERNLFKAIALLVLECERLQELRSSVLKTQTPPDSPPAESQPQTETSPA